MLLPHHLVSQLIIKLSTARQVIVCLSILCSRIHRNQFTKKKTVQGLWTWNGKVVLPADQQLREEVISLNHDAVWSGHRGIRKTVKLVSRHYWWSTLEKDVRNYVLSCDVCQRVKSLNHKADGPGQALPIPEGPWQSVSFDLVMRLPVTTKGFNRSTCDC